MTPADAYHEYLGPALFAPCADIVLAAAQIATAERVLDVACGTGIVTAQIRAARVVGLDVNPQMLAVARSAAGIAWVEGSALALPFGDAAFDVVICQQGLQFFADRAAAAREMRRVGGRAVVACWQSLAQQTVFATVVRAQAKLLGVTVEEVAAPFAFGDAGALGRVLREAGFTTVEVTTHVIAGRFRAPERFLDMCAHAALATMPDRFGDVDPDELAVELRAACASELGRYITGDTLRFPIPTNLARAW